MSRPFAATSAKLAAKPFTALSADELQELLAGLGEPAFRTAQVVRWIYGAGVRSFEEMSDLPSALRSELARSHRLRSLEVKTIAPSSDGLTRKLLLQAPDGVLVESVLLPRRSGFALCVSSQSGCAMGCPFCATGRMGFARNLTAGEIVDQFLLALGVAREQGSTVKSVVFMGMGEPLANRRNVKEAVAALVSAEKCGLGARHITVSTIGLRGRIRGLAGWPWQIGLAVSLHAPNDALRKRLVPAGSRMGIAALMAECREYQRLTSRRVTYEYVMLDGVNDLPEHRRELAELLRGQLCHVNLIPYNSVAGAGFAASKPEAVVALQRALEKRGIAATVRASRGRDIAAACGQLAAQA